MRHIRYHDASLVNLREDLIVMHVTPSLNAGDFHDWLRNTVLADVVVPPNGVQSLEFEAKRGWYDVFAPQVHALSYLIAREDGVSEVELELFDGQMLPEEVTIKTGPVRVRVHNMLPGTMPALLGFLGDDNDEHPEPYFRIEPFLTGKRLLTSQTFRTLFKAESVEIGTGLQLKNLTVLFTDLQASTAMYERVGDMNALGIVRRHFDVLEAAVTRERGAVVKTIGDAVMAVFADSDRAMAAAAEMIATVRRAVAHGEDLVLKIGIHQGSCVATQSNSQLDYFGRTVNIAARVQDLAEGGQIVCSEEVWNAPGVQRLVEERHLKVRREVAPLKGIADRFPVRRIIVADVPAAAGAATSVPRTRVRRAADSSAARKTGRKPKTAKAAARRA